MELRMRVLFGAVVLLSAVSVVVRSAEEQRNHIRVPPLTKGNNIKFPVSGAKISNLPPLNPSKVNLIKFPPFNPPKNPPFNPTPVNHPKFPPFNPPPVNHPKYPPPAVPSKYLPFNPPPVNPPFNPPPVHPPFHPPPPVNPPFYPPPVNPPFHPPPVIPPFHPPPVIPPFHPPPVIPPFHPPPVIPPFHPPPVIPPFHPPPVIPPFHPPPVIPPFQPPPVNPLPHPIPPPVNPFPIPPLPPPINPPHPPHPPHPPPTCNVCDTLDAGFGKINDSFSEIENLVVNLIDEAESCVPKGSTDFIVREGPIATCPEGTIVFQCRCKGPCAGAILTEDDMSCTSVPLEDVAVPRHQGPEAVPVIAYCAYNFNGKLSIQKQENDKADSITCPSSSKVVSCFGSLEGTGEIETTIDVENGECNVSDSADCGGTDTCLFFAVCKQD